MTSVFLTKSCQRIPKIIYAGNAYGRPRASVDLPARASRLPSCAGEQAVCRSGISGASSAVEEQISAKLRCEIQGRNQTLKFTRARTGKKNSTADKSATFQQNIKCIYVLCMKYQQIYCKVFSRTKFKQYLKKNTSFIHCNVQFNVPTYKARVLKVYISISYIYQVLPSTANNEKAIMQLLKSI